MHTSRTETHLLIPATALNYVFGANKVYVVKNNQIDAREVKLGDRFGTDVEISEGLSDAETVATSQISKLESGTRVTVSGTP